MSNLQRLLEIMSALRSERRCPWDREQTRESLKPFLVEETYEVLEALDEDDPEKIKEELGDLLFQIVFHCQMAKELDEFDMDDVIKKISDKMIARHPHVFGEARLKTPEEVLIHWNERKKREKGLGERESILDGVPMGLPSLLRAQRLQARAGEVGFDWRCVEDVMEKLDEEMRELREAVKSKSQKEIEEELGDVLFVLVNVSRFVGVNAEDALRKTISKFISCFRYIEMRAADANRDLLDMSIEEMDTLWEEAKTVTLK